MVIILIFLLSVFGVPFVATLTYIIYAFVSLANLPFVEIQLETKEKKISGYVKSVREVKI